MRFGAATVGDLTWKEMVDSFSCTECGRCQDVCPAYATGKTLSPKLLIMGIRDQLLAEGPNAARRRGADPDRRERRARGDGLGLRHVRRVRPRVPRVDRARRPHRRPAPQPRDDGLELPAGGGVDAARRRAGRQSLGQAAGRPRRLGRRAGCARRRGGRARARDPLLGRLRRRLRRACAPGGRVDREAAAEGRGRLRDSRRARGVHGRPGSPDGQRVRVPVVRGAERHDAERCRRHEDRRQLPALPELARQ